MVYHIVMWKFRPEVADTYVRPFVTERACLDYEG